MISRRAFLQSMGLGLAASALPQKNLWSQGTGLSGSGKPNILVIVTDDQGYADLGAYSHHAPDISTPNMDRIARDGVRFTQGYVSAPVCSPSRAGWNSGCYQERWGNWQWKSDFPADRTTIAEYLREAGYVTGKVGEKRPGCRIPQARQARIPAEPRFR